MYGHFGKIRGYITSQGTLVKNGKLIVELLEAIHLPKQITRVKCRARTKQRDMVSKENAFADLAAKQEAKSQQIANRLVKEKMRKGHQLLMTLQHDRRQLR